MKHAIVVSAEDLEKKIFLIRGQKVMLDVHLAKLYGVSTKRLKQQVWRNQQRFPNDFLFELTAEELAGLRLQFATSKTVRGGTRYMPFAFTERECCYNNAAPSAITYYSLIEQI